MISSGLMSIRFEFDFSPFKNESYFKPRAYSPTIPAW